MSDILDNTNKYAVLDLSTISLDMGTETTSSMFICLIISSSINFAMFKYFRTLRMTLIIIVIGKIFMNNMYKVEYVI